MIESITPRPLLSVIVANYNKESYLGECLESVLNQSYKDLETVVYDDGSSDGSPAIVADFQKRYPDIIKIIHDPVNRGVACARHQAILAARGDYLTTLDSDDYYLSPEKLQQEMELVLSTRRERGQDIIAFSAFVPVDRSGQRLTGWIEKQPIREGRIFPDILGRSCLIPRDYVMNRSLYFAAGGYDVSLSSYEDWDLKLRLAQRYDFRYSGLCGTAYRRDGQGLSERPFPEQLKNLLRVFKRHYPDIEASNRKQVLKDFRSFVRAQGRHALRPGGNKTCGVYLALLRMHMRLASARLSRRRKPSRHPLP